jgi:hypothetical protein
MSEMIQVFVLKNAHGQFYTGSLSGGMPEFSADRDEAIELDADEAREEMAGMQADVTLVLDYEFPRKKPSGG